MKKISIAFCTFIVLGTQISNAQKSCEIYNLIVDSVYQRFAHPLVAANLRIPMDPSDPKIDTPIKYKQISVDYNLQIARKYIEFNKFDLSNWYFKLINDESLKYKKFTSNESDKVSSISSCWVERKTTYNALFPENGKEIEGFDTLSERNSKSLMNIILSNIIYSSDNKIALVYLKCTLYPGQSNHSIWAYELKNKNKKWYIKKVVGSPDK